jgi:hypothetical protein
VGFRSEAWPGRATIAVAGASLSIIGASSAHTVLPSSAAVAARAHKTVLLTRRKLPEPTAKIGTYRYRSAIHATVRWQRIRTDTKTFVRQHFPHPEVLSGINPIFDKGAAPIALSVTSAYPLQGPGTDTDNRYGYGAHSIQNNVFFYGNNGPRRRSIHGSNTQ